MRVTDAELGIVSVPLVVIVVLGMIILIECDSSSNICVGCGVYNGCSCCLLVPVACGGDDQHFCCPHGTDLLPYIEYHITSTLPEDQNVAQKIVLETSTTK